MSPRRSRLETVAAWLRPRRPRPPGEAVLLLSGRERFASGQAILSAFYAVLFFLAAGQIYSWQGYLAATELDPRWPVLWMPWLEPKTAISIVLWLHLAGGVAALTLVRYRWGRVLVFLSLLQFLAFRFSFGAINHGAHLGLLLAFVLIFLPTGWRGWPTAPRQVRAATLLVVAGCQSLLMLTYTLSGFWKVLGIGRQVVAGESHYLHPDGLARQVAAKLLAADEVSLLGPWLIDHPWAGLPLIVAAILLELFALWAVFRPTLHQLWGVGLIALHLGTHLTLGIGFVENTLWLALFFVLSPFRRPRGR
ncbi:MAG: hypothetical protein R3325_09955 [Thermoanaerobaculia bacterium]|nr:hypothetical protein [Thermoanaerobaculia bacterium]